jgi:RNA polymerase sigma-70 factor (ECF subfamily)
VRAVEQVFRAEGGAVLASLARLTGDLGLAEDALMDALASALERWPVEGTPATPGAWITTTARRKAIDRLRRRASHKKYAPALSALIELEAAGREAPDPDELRDDQLRLVFTCCHPALAPDAQIALTLRTVCGLTTPEIARAFLVPEPTLAQRLVRVKKKIQDAGIPYRVPSAEELPERIDAVLHVVYLIFNEGYWATAGDVLVRDELCLEALRLGEHLRALMPDELEVAGLCALMTLHHARREQRFDTAGDLVLLDAQDRSRWDRAAIRRGVAEVERVLALGRPGPYQIQAAIAAVHAEATRAEDTDWSQIAGLYVVLRGWLDTPVVRVNEAVAVAMADGPAAGLARLDALPAMDAYLAYHAARADLLRRLDRKAEARDAYARAHALADNQVVARYLARRRDALGEG